MGVIGIRSKPRKCCAGYISNGDHGLVTTTSTHLATPRLRIQEAGWETRKMSCARAGERGEQWRRGLDSDDGVRQVSAMGRQMTTNVTSLPRVRTVTTMPPDVILPRDARLVALLVSSSPSIADAQPAVLLQLLEFAHRTPQLSILERLQDG